MAVGFKAAYCTKTQVNCVFYFFILTLMREPSHKFKPYLKQSVNRTKCEEAGGTKKKGGPEKRGWGTKREAQEKEEAVL